MSERLNDVVVESDMEFLQREHEEDRALLVERMKSSRDRAEVIDLARRIYGPASALLAAKVFDTLAASGRFETDPIAPRNAA